MKKKFYVECTCIYNGSIIVEVDNDEVGEDDCAESVAVDKAREFLNGDYLDGFPNSVDCGDVHFEFAEATADYAEEYDE